MAIDSVRPVVLRAFNEAFQRAYSRPPSDLRRRRRSALAPRPDVGFAA